jgi:hypothetical protein
MTPRKTRVLRITLSDDTNFTIQVKGAYSIVEAFDNSGEFLVVEGADDSELVVPTRLITSAVLGAKS